MRRIVVAAMVAFLAPTVLADVSIIGHLPSPRDSTTATTVDDHTALILGGRPPDGTFLGSGNGGFLDDIVRFDATTGTAELIGHLPVGSTAQSGRAYAASATVAGKTYVFGGAVSLPYPQGVLIQGGTELGSYVPETSADIIEIDPSTGASRLTLDRLPTSSWGAFAFVGPRSAETLGLPGSRSDVIYVLGGLHFEAVPPVIVDAAYLDTIVQYDPSMPEGLRIHTLAQHLPYAVVWTGGAASGTTAYLAGGLASGVTGCSFGSTCLTRNVAIFDAATGTTRAWNDTLPESVQSPASAIVEGRMLVTGGRNSWGNTTTNVLGIDLVSGHSAPLSETLPRPGFSASAVALAGTMYAFGGRENGPPDASDLIVGLT